MATWLRKLRVDEISLCDRGANPHAVVLLAKRAEQETNMQTISTDDRQAIAKGMVALGFDRATLYGIIRKMAADDRQAGESIEAAVMRVRKTDKGATLMAAYNLAPGPDWQPAPREPVAKAAQRGTAGDEIDRRARALRVTQPAMSLAQARIHVRNQDPALKERERQEELAA
jgi:hypothetical protein